MVDFVLSALVNSNLHILQAVGAGQHHHDELALDVYKNPRTRIYVDNWASARTELATLDAQIVGEVGDLINEVSSETNDGITIFHSMGKKCLISELFDVECQIQYNLFIF